MLDAWAAHIEMLLETQWDLMDGGHRWEPSTQSPLEQLRARLRRKAGPSGVWDGMEAESAGRLATMWLAVSGQHLEGIRALLHSRQLIFPMAPIARSVVEAAGRTFWLISPHQPMGRELPARVWMGVLEDVTRRVTTAKGWKDVDQRSLSRLVGDKKKIRDTEIPSRFYPSEIENFDGELVLRGQRLPGLSGALQHVSKGMSVEDLHTPMYAYLSDATHPTPYAAMGAVTNFGDGTDLRTFGSADLQREYMIFQSAVQAYQQHWLLATAYFGQKEAPVISACDRLGEVPAP